MKWTTLLPTELWIMVLDTLDFSDLEAISLTCRNFRSLATPRLFRRLFIGLSSEGWYYLGKPDHRTFVSLEDMRLTAASPSLAFYGSEHIAPLVREFWLSVSTSRYHPRQPSVGVVLDILPRFSNVRSVGFASLRVTQTIVQTIAQLPALMSVTVRNCSYDNWEGPLLRLKNVSLFHYRPSDVEGKWPFTVQPELLESLHVDAFTFPNFSSLPNLRTLHVNGDGGNAIPIIRCLDFLTKCNCPSLDTLILSRCRFVHGELAAFDRSTLPTIPYLKVYHGPSALIPLFAAGSSLHRVSLSDFTRRDDYPPEDITDSLHKLHALAPNLVALTIDVVCPSEAIARAIPQFGALEELYLETKNTELEPMQACQVITSQFHAQWVFLTGSRRSGFLRRPEQSDSTANPSSSRDSQSNSTNDLAPSPDNMS
jgi:hypothetical protein